MAMRWIVRDRCADIADIHFEARDAEDAMAQWFNLLGLAPSDPDIDLQAERLCSCDPGCNCGNNS